MIEVSVIGNSMEPSINDGDLLYFNLINDINEVNVNDVVFQGKLLAVWRKV